MARLSKAKIDLEINKFAKLVIKRARGNLTRTQRVSSKDLWKSLRYKYAKERLRFYMNCYGPFIDQGVSGTGKGDYTPSRPRRVARSIAKPRPYTFKKGPAGPEAERSFYDWINQNNIKPRNKLGQFVKVTENSMRTLNFLLRRSTGRFGIPPSRFFSEAYAFYEPQFEKALDKAIGLSITEAVNRTFEDTFTRCKG